MSSVGRAGSGSVCALGVHGHALAMRVVALEANVRNLGLVNAAVVGWEKERQRRDVRKRGPSRVEVALAGGVDGQVAHLRGHHALQRREVEVLGRSVHVAPWN